MDFNSYIQSLFYVCRHSEKYSTSGSRLGLSRACPHARTTSSVWRRRTSTAGASLVNQRLSSRRRQWRRGARGRDCQSKVCFCFKLWLFNSPQSNIRTSLDTVLSCWWRWISCFYSTVWANRGFSNENRVLCWRFRNSSKSVLLVVMWGVLWYNNMKVRHPVIQRVMPILTYPFMVSVFFWIVLFAAPVEDVW